MGSFYELSVGAPTLAADVNQLIDGLNGTTNVQATIKSPNATSWAITGQLASVPSTDQSVLRSLVPGDTISRIAQYIRGSDGYGGIHAGAGTGLTAHLYAQSGGWKTDEGLTVAGVLSATGGLSGTTATLSGALSGTSGSFSGAVAAASLAATGAVTGASATVTGALTAGSLSSDAGKVTSDGAGNLSVQTITTAGGSFAVASLTTTGSATVGTSLSSDAGKITSSGSGDLTVHGALSTGNAGFTVDGSGNLTKVGAITASGAITGASITTTGAISTGGGAFATDGSGNISALGSITFSGSPTLSSRQSSGATGLAVQTWTGTAAAVPFSVGGQLSSAKTWLDNSGSLYLTGAAATYGRISSLQSGASATGLAFQTWNGTTAKVPFSIGGQFNSALAYVDNSGALTAAGLTLTGAGAFTVTGALSTDGANFTTDGSGNISKVGNIASSGAATFSSIGTFISHTSGSSISTGSVNYPNNLNVNAGGVLYLNSGNFISMIGGYVGMKTSSNGRYFEAHGDGHITIGGNNMRYSSGSMTWSAGTDFDSYDVAELYPTAQEYPGGTVVCLDEDDGLFHQCTHDACRFASVISTGAGMQIGFPPEEAEDRPEGTAALQYLALAGRLRSQTRETLSRRTFVCSDGYGGVRAIRPGESAQCLGYTLSKTADDGMVGLVVRPSFVTAQQQQ